ncbi:MAG: pantetheine-phosphate adenylyltransferase [Clostridiales bacterium]|nr:pantetheine-phosphate adenylyltransferase [Clostridiales bacterium]
MKTAICPGSFDPVTLGHIDIIERAATLFDRVIILVMTNSKKEAMFKTEERVNMIKRCIKGENITVDTYGGLLVNYAFENNADVIVKGLRAVSDFDYEFQQALTNKSLMPGIETVFLAASGKNMFLSSSMVKEVCQLGGNIEQFVSPEILNDVIKRCKGEKNYD